MSRIAVVVVGVICCLLAAGCNVGVTEKADAGQGEQGNDTGSGAHEDGGARADSGRPTDGGGADAEACPAIAPQYPCETQADCPSGYVCQVMFPDMPWCGSACVQVGVDAGVTDVGLPDGGNPDAGQCLSEGESINKTGNPNPTPCCPGLDALPQLAVDPAGGCAAPACDCVVCTKPCGSGDCSAGKNPCNCPQDCPASLPGGPGSKCAGDNDCKGGASCLTEKSGYPTGGYCAGPVCDLFGDPGQCPAGTICLPMDFAQAPGLCMKACASDQDCRQGLTCEAMPVSQRYMGTPYFCWQSGAGGLGKGLGQVCKDGTECITRDCEALGAGSVKVCTQYCFTEQACKHEQICISSPNCRDQPPACGMCVYPVK